MAVKTAISLEESLFERVEALTKQLNISRSHLFALAAQQFIERYENRLLLEAINTAYDDVLDPQEQALRQQMRSHHRQLVEGQW